MQNSRFLSKVDPSSDAYNTVKQRLNDTIVNHKGSSNFRAYILNNVYEVKNPNLKARYDARKIIIAHEMGRSTEDVPFATMLFHGTKKAAAMEIIENGFKVSNANPNGMFGKGIYFANKSSKSNQYSDETLLLCNVLLGKKYCTTKAMNRITAPPNGCHSVEGSTMEGGLNYPEYIIYDGNQAYPTYLVDYSIQY